MAAIANIAKGIAIGISLLVPGVSGGTMAIILGIYDDLIHAISSFFKDMKRHTLLLLEVGCGGLIGILLFSKLISMALERFEFPMIYLFLGVICGGIPVLYKKVKPEGGGAGKLTDYLYGIGGLAIALLMLLEPGTVVNMATQTGILSFVFLVVVGFLVAIALILPGISTTFFLLTLGLYDVTLTAINERNIAFLAPILIGCAVGTISTTKVLENLMQKHPRQTYMAILGFVVGSLVQVFPGLPQGWDILFCLLTLAVGFLVMRLLDKSSNKA